MTVASINAGGDFRVGDVLSRAWSIFTGNILFFLAVPFLINVVYVIVGAAIGIFVAIGAATTSPALLIVGAVIGGLFALCLYVFGQGVLLIGAFQRLRGEPLRVGVAVQHSMARVMPLIGLTLLAALAMIGLMLVFGAVVWVVALALGRFAILSFVIWLGLFVLLFMLMIMWSVVVPACLVERLGPVQSLARSADLTKGYRWRITGIMLLLFLAVLAAVLLILAVTPLGTLVADIIRFVWSVAWTGFVNCAIIMIYHDLRVAKEGVDTAQLASVFD
jgi:hypothetical protein